MPMKVAIYARVSQKSEANDSVANQVKALEAYAKAKGYELVAPPFRDDGVSGYKGVKREGFDALLASLPKIDRILVRHADRLERNPKDRGALHAGCALHGVSIEDLDGHVTDLSTGAGGLTATVLSGIAHFESRVKSERQRMANQAQREQGLYIRRGAFGYIKDKPHPVEAPLVRAAFEAVAAGRSTGSIVKAWNEAGVQTRGSAPKWTYAHVNQILTRPTYAGLVAHKGEILEGVIGQWEPLIDVETFWKVQSILKDPSRRTSPGYQPVWLTSGLAICGVCRGTMRSSSVTDKRVGTHKAILKCRATKDGIRHSSGDLLVVDALARDAVIAAFTFGPTSLFPDEGGEDLSAIVADLESNNQAVEDVYADEDAKLIDRAQARVRLARLSDTRKGLEALLEASRGRSAALSMQVDLRRSLFTTKRVAIDDVATVKATIGERFDALHIEQKRELVSQLLKVTVMPGRGSDKYVIEHQIVTSLND